MPVSAIEVFHMVPINPLRSMTKPRLTKKKTTIGNRIAA